MEERDLIRKIDVFAHLDDSEADAILEHMRERRARKGSILFHQWDEDGGLFLILEGVVKISRIGRDGREVTIALLREGNFFGEMSLIDGQPRSATATAVTPCRLLILERQSFARGVLPRTRIVAKLLCELSKRLRAANQNIENLALGTVYDRLFHLLSHLARQFTPRDGAVEITKRPTHQELAEMVGSSRETVTRTLAAMEKKGIIRMEKRTLLILPPFFEEEASRV